MILGIIISFVYIIGIIVIASILNSKQIISREGSRKFIHILLANWWFIAMYYFKTPFSAAIVPGIFVVLNYLSYKKDIIEAMEREKEEDTLGTVYYAISLLVLSLITFREKSNPWIGAAGILSMGYGDGFAGILGRKYGRYKIKFKNINKSLEGTIAMFIFSFIPLLAILYYLGNTHLIVYAIIISAIATITELFSPSGTDNLTVPFIVSLSFYLLVF